MTGFITAIYITLMIIFLASSALIVRHAITYSYLSSRFKKLVAIFSVISIGVIVFSIYLMMELYSASSSSTPSYSSPATSTSSSSGINF